MSIVQDVKLQMDAKLWAEEYNRHNPPKKVLIKISTCIATFFLASLLIGCHFFCRLIYFLWE